MKTKTFIRAIASLVLLTSLCQGQQVEQQPLTKVIKSATGDFSTSAQWKVPMIAWGGDLQEIEANGGLKTASNSIFAKKGLDITLFRQDDFRKQVELYKKGEINFLRGTIGMLNSATELLNQDEKTTFEVIYLLTRSAGGDALVAKNNIKSAKDLKGKTIAVQAYGPHVDYLTTILRSVGLTTKDIKIEWCPDLFEVDQNSYSPITALQKPNIDAAFAIIPDALAVTSNGTVGNGAEGTIKGAKILLSTKTASNVIYDVFAVRKAFAAKYPNKVKAFVHGMLLGQESLATKMKAGDKVTLTRGAGILLDDQSATDDMKGMYLDAAHASWADNKNFLNSSNGRNFHVVSEKVQEDFVTMGLLSRKVPIKSSIINFDNHTADLANIKDSDKPKFKKEKVDELLAQKTQKGSLTDGELYSFEIYFQPGQNTFLADQYKSEFEKAIELMTTFGGAILTVEGHSDPLGYLKNKYKNNASPLILQKQKQAALNLSFSRANAVKASLIKYAEQQNMGLDESQFGVIGHGIMHPTFTLNKDGDLSKANAPKTKAEWNSMRRVKFRLIQVEAEADVFEPLDL